MPWPKARWRFGVRVGSKVSGSGNCAASRLAEPIQAVLRSPSAMVQPPSSTPRAAVRNMTWTGQW
jgi:hypothetical protein